MTHRHIHPSLAVVVALVMSACATASSSPARTTTVGSLYGATAASQSYGLDRIQRTGALTARDALRLLLPFHRVAHTAADAPRLPHNVRAPWEAPGRLIIDGHRVDNPNVLRQIRASDLIAIHVLRGTDASARFGSAFLGGAIIIQTRFFRG